MVCNSSKVINKAIFLVLRAVLEMHLPLFASLSDPLPQNFKIFQNEVKVIKHLRKYSRIFGLNWNLYRCSFCLKKQMAGKWEVSWSEMINAEPSRV